MLVYLFKHNMLHIYISIICYIFMVASSWNFLSYFPVFSQLFLISQLFLTYFPKISQLFCSHYPFLAYFPVISHLFLYSHLFLTYFSIISWFLTCFPLISHLFLNYFLVISQLYFDCFCVFKPFATLFLMVCFHMVNKYVN